MMAKGGNFPMNWRISDMANLRENPRLRALRICLVDLGERQAGLVLVLAALVGVADGAGLVALEEDELGDPLVGVNLGRQGGGVADLERDLAAPLGLDRRDVDDDAATGVGALADADGQHV